MASKKQKADRLLADIAIEGQAYLERLKSGFTRDYNKIFPELEKVIAEILSATKVENLSELTRRELDATLKELRQAQYLLYADANSQLIDQLGDTAGYTTGKLATDYGKYFTSPTIEGFEWDVPKARATWESVTTTPIQATGELLMPFVKRITDGNVARVENAVRNGWAQGKTISQMTREIYGTKANGYKDGLTEMNRRGVEAMVRTATQHTAMAAQMRFFEANNDLVIGYQWISTLDSRTTSKCRSLDRLRFKMGEGPVPPGHIGCRSAIRPDLGPDFDFLREGATRSSDEGYVDQKMTYYDWLKTQSPEKVKDVLGANRAKLFMDGGMTAKEFARYNMGRNFEPLTLAELYTRDPEPFTRAGVPVPAGVSAVPPPVDLAAKRPPGIPPQTIVYTQEEWEESLTPAQRRGLEYWSESLETVTDVRRAASGEEPTNKAAYDFLDALSNAPNMEPRWLYRGETFDGKIGDLFPVGKEFQFRPLTSTSKSSMVAEEFMEYGTGNVKVLFRVTSSEAIDISNLVAEEYLDQYEVLLRGDGTYKVSYVERRSDGSYYVEVNQVMK